MNEQDNGSDFHEDNKTINDIISGDDCPTENINDMSTFTARKRKMPFQTKQGRIKRDQVKKTSQIGNL